MRALVLGVCGFVLMNVLLGAFGRSIALERQELSERLGGLTRDADEARAASEQRRELQELVALAETTSLSRPLEIGPLRDILFGAEQGLSLERLSLDFRPEQRLPDGFGGAKIHASLRGSLEALFTYLDRIEAMHLPLVPEALTMRDDGTTLLLTIRWSARWPLPVEATSPALAPQDVARLASWLERKRTPNLGRDLFSLHTVSAPSPSPTPAPAETLDPATETELDSGAGVSEVSVRPELTGFVLARPELESDVTRRILVALRYEGGMRLMKVGDTIGDYVVERIAARESVTLKHSRTGERVVLRLE